MICSDMPSVTEWYRQLSTMAGYRAIAWQKQVEQIAYIFQANVAEYRRFLATLQWRGSVPPEMDVANPDTLEQVLCECQRLLHNVLTAISTRVDQLRRFVGHNFAADESIAIEYRARVNSLIVGDVAAAFLKNLRNHLTHVQLPIVLSTETINTGSIASDDLDLV